MTPAVVIIGPPGAGKSTVGAMAAAALGLDFRDTDDLVEAAAGASVAEIFLDHGEGRFRELERAAVATSLTEHDGVLAVGGGAVVDPAARAALRNAYVVFLDVALGDGVRRVGLDVARPLLLDSPRRMLRRLMEERRAYYDEVASVRIDTTGRTPEDVAAEVAALVRGLT